MSEGLFLRFSAGLERKIGKKEEGGGEQQTADGGEPAALQCTRRADCSAQRRRCGDGTQNAADSRGAKDGKDRPEPSGYPCPDYAGRILTGLSDLAIKRFIYSVIGTNHSGNRIILVHDTSSSIQNRNLTVTVYHIFRRLSRGFFQKEKIFFALNEEYADSIGELEAFSMNGGMPEQAVSNRRCIFAYSFCAM